MSTFLETYRRILMRIGQVEQIFGGVLLTTIVLSITAQVFFRYVLNNPLIWVMELSTYCFIWGVFIGASFGLKQMRHIIINTFVAWLPRRLKAIFHLIAQIIILIVAVVLAIKAWQVIGIENRSTTISLPVMLPKSWFFSVPMLTSAILIAMTSIYFILAEIMSLMNQYVVEPICGKQEQGELYAKTAL